MSEVVHTDIEFCVPVVLGNAMCSTIVLKDLSNSECVGRGCRCDFVGGFKKFADTVRKSLNWLGTKNHFDYYAYVNQKVGYHWKNTIPSYEYKASDYAFCMASTDEEQILVKKHLKTLGFSGTSVQYNSKNNTCCQLFVIPMGTLLKTLDELQGDS